MLRLAAVALVIGLALPACAQRGGGGFHGGGGGFHGGGFAHMGSGFRGGPSRGFHGNFSGPRSFGSFTPRRSLGFGSPSIYRPYRNLRYRQGYRSGFRSYGRRPDYWRGRRSRDHFRHRVFSGFAPPLFFYSVPAWIGLGPVGCDPGDDVSYYDGYDDFDCNDMYLNDQNQSPDQSQDQPQVYGGDNDNGYESQPPNGYGSEPPPPPPDQPQYEPPAYHQPNPSRMPADQIAANQTTTIIFNNGHAPEKIHDYALTMTTLYILGQHQQEIPLSQINLAATEQANRSAGVEFHVPQYQITQ